MEAITTKISKFNPFNKPHQDSDDLGENLAPDSIGGGGHGALATKITQEELRVSPAIQRFLVRERLLSAHEIDPSSETFTDALKALLDLPHIEVPREWTDRKHPLTEYFISSSHNTYLLAHQLYGSSSAVAYEKVLKAGARCVEVDCWDDVEEREEPRVTHGYTLTSSIPFRRVCETIRDVYDREQAGSGLGSGGRAAPILLSLENHCGDYGQLRLVSIMKEVWGDRLLSKRVRDEGSREEQGTGEHIDLIELGSKIAVIVEYHLPNEADSSSEDEDEDEPEEEKQDRKTYQRQKKECPQGIIIPQLAELGVYAQSCKPSNNSWFESTLEDRPNNHLINISESGLLPLMATATPKIATHNAHHLMRVYPKGTRISSRNLNPVPFWSLGAQICALNWQTFDASMQLNEALFAGTDGYVLKPAALRAGGSGVLNPRDGKKRRLKLRIVGASNIPVPSGREGGDVKPYVTCTLVHPDDTEKKKTKAYHQHNNTTISNLLHRGENDFNPPNTDPLWDEVLEWTYPDNEMTFLRILIKSDDSYKRNPVFGVAAVRVAYMVEGWRFIRMLDLQGRETRCSVLVEVGFGDA